MKKLISIVFILILVTCLTMIPSFSADLSESIRVYRNLAKLEVNGSPVTTDNFLYNGTTYIPIRAAVELLGKEVGWNNYAKTVSINDYKYEKEVLSSLLPSKVGYKWIYNGFAEYGHEMKIDQIKDEAEKRTYSISGEVGDPSGGESNRNLNISLKYIITGNQLIQEKTEEAMMDSKFNPLTLIKAPLVLGTYWTEKVTNQNGQETTINAHIKKVELSNMGKVQYTVRYQDTNSPYYEERVIQEGTGVISFEKLLELDKESFPVSYFLYLNEENNKTIMLNLYFPDKQGEKVHLEQRTIPLKDSGTARAAIEGLIAGPTNADLAPSLPSGVKLLDIYIKDKICYVDFSKEFIDNHNGGSAGELMTVSSIVNTLTVFNSIDQVQILVEGETDKSLGNMVLDRPLDRMVDLIGK